MMRRVWLFPFLAVLILCSAAKAQTDITPLLSKKQFSNDEVTRIGIWLEDVARRYQKATDATNRNRQLENIRKIVDDKAATPEFKAVLAEQFGKVFNPFLTGSDLWVSWPVMVLLDRLPPFPSRGAFITALTSASAAVRYSAAKGLREAAASLPNAADYQPVLDALAQAGSSESDPIALDMIYQAVAAVESLPQFAGHDEVAKALTAIFDA